MPTVLRVGPYRFFFYADGRQEPAHVHVIAAGKEAKFWLLPIELSWNDGYRSGELKEIESLVREHLDFLLEAWNVFFQTRS